MIRYELSIAIPSNILEDGKGLRGKTEKIGIIARAAAIFGVRKIYIYDINQTKNDAKLIELLLNYMGVPQYLRKMVFPIQKELRFAGQLPPLKIPSHQVPKSLDLVRKGDIRQGLVLKKGQRPYVELGLERPLPMITSETVREFQVVAVVIAKEEPNAFCQMVTKDKVEKYWGYEVIGVQNIRTLISRSKPGVVLLTSRLGKPLNKVWKSVIERISQEEKCLVVFGSPRVGIYEILSQEKLKISEIGAYSVNLFPNQTVETIRSEEAILAGLGLLNFLRRLAG